MNTASEILAFIRKSQFCSLATIEAGEPRVRMVMILRADENGILFNTGVNKDLYKQIEANPAVELCFYDPAAQIQVRVHGRFAPQRDEATINLVLEKLPFLRALVAERGSGALSPYILKKGRATVWTLANNMAPKTYVDL
jgi:uncharacterized pyridoxamine 5'-phosphate oxidase family protein